MRERIAELEAENTRLRAARQVATAEWALLSRSQERFAIRNVIGQYYCPNW
jgi:hypothetical protein